MANKQVHRVSPELTDDAQFKAVEHIPTTMLKDGDTILVYPGEYSDPRTANVANVTIQGFGGAKDVVFNGFSIPSDGPGGANVAIKNITIRAAGLIVGNTASTVTVEDCIIDGTSGPSRAAALALANGAVTTGVLDSNAAVAATDAASVVKIERCVLGSNISGGYGIVAHNNSGSLSVRHSRIASDAGMLINVATAIEHCTFTGANAYASAIAAGGTPTATVRLSVAAAANAGNMTETVVAAIS